VVGVVKGGAYGRRFLVGGVDVASLTCLSRHAPGETQDLTSRLDAGGVFGVAFPLGGIVLEMVSGQERPVVLEGVCRCGLPLFRFLPGFPLINRAVWVF
jgi:hypothetical protein